MQQPDVICDYCSMPAMRITGRDLHPLRPDLADKHYHLCRNCDAWVGCRDGSWEPLGRLANADLRRAKQTAHAALEPIWADAMRTYGWTKNRARNLAYAWLHSEMGLPRNSHIGWFSLEQCQLVVLICRHRDPALEDFILDRPRAGVSVP